MSNDVTFRIGGQVIAWHKTGAWCAWHDEYPDDGPYIIDSGLQAVVDAAIEAERECADAALPANPLDDVVATLRLDSERLTAPTTPRDYARGKAYEIEKGYHIGSAEEYAEWKARKASP